MAATQVGTTRVGPPLNGAPALGGGLPYLGHAPEFRRDPLGLLQRGRDRFGDVFFFPLMGQRVMALTGPQANETFFRAPDKQLSPKEAYRFTVPIFGKGVAYDCDPAVMDEQLGLVFPALREERLQAYARIMAQEAEAYTSTWGAEGVVDLYTATNELTTFIASRCLVGEEFRRNLSTEFASLYHDMEKAINMLAFFHPYLPVPSFRRRDKARARMGEMISAIVAARKAAPRQGYEDFLETLMAARYSDGQIGRASCRERV